MERGERGAACAVYHRGTKVVDLWGGYRCIATRHQWQQDTLVLAFSATKGMAAAAMTVAYARGLFELDEAVASYWPEFAQAGKGDITVRQLLARTHESRSDTHTSGGHTSRGRPWLQMKRRRFASDRLPK